MLVFHILQIREKNFWFQRCLLLPEFPVLSAFLLPRGRLQSSTSGSGRGATAETELTLMCPLVNFDLLDNLFLDCASGNSSFYAKAGNEIQAAISWVRGAVVVARAQSHDQPSWQTGGQRQTGVLQDQWKLLLKLLSSSICVFLMLIPISDPPPQVQRERLDSEGLPSPIEDCSPENQPPSPTATTL